MRCSVWPSQPHQVGKSNTFYFILQKNENCGLREKEAYCPCGHTLRAYWEAPNWMIPWLRKYRTLRSTSSPCLSTPCSRSFQTGLIEEMRLCVYTNGPERQIFSKWWFLCSNYHAWNTTVYTAQLYILGCGFLSCLLNTHTHIHTAYLTTNTLW